MVYTCFHCADSEKTALFWCMHVTRDQELLSIQTKAILRTCLTRRDVIMRLAAAIGSQSFD